MLVRSCLIRRLQPTCPPSQKVHVHIGVNACTTPSQWRAFHQTSRMGARPGMPNHYETLDIPTSATPTEVKKYVNPTLLNASQSKLTNFPPTQTILQALQIQPPRPAPQRSLQIKALRRYKRSLLDPRLPRKASNLRSRLPPFNPRFLLRPP